MTSDLDALIIRSLPDLHDTAVRWEALSERVCAEIDAEIASWIDRNGWAGAAQLHEDGETWLAPTEWMVPDDPDKTAHLNFSLDATGAAREDDWYLESFTGAGQQQMGFWLTYDWNVRKTEWKRAWRELANTGGLPLRESEFFLPVLIDREVLAVAMEKGEIADALQPVREALDRLPQLASQLEPLKQQLVAFADARKASQPG